MSNRNILSSPRIREIKKNKRKIIFRKSAAYLLILLVLFTGLAFLSRWEKLNIKIIEVRGIGQSDAEKVKGSIENELLGDYLFFFPKTNIALVPKGGIKQELESSFKRFKDIETDITRDGIFRVSLSERESAYLWCGEEFHFGEEVSKCYFMDESGYIFDEAPYFSGDVYFKFFGQADGVGSQFMPEAFEKTLLFRDILTETGLEPVAMTAKADGDMEFYLPSMSSTLALPPRIIFKSEADIQKLSENLQTALVTEPLVTEWKAKYAELEYIDLRFGNKVYYKFR